MRQLDEAPPRDASRQRESTWQVCMRLLRAAGDNEEAVEACNEVLADELVHHRYADARVYVGGPSCGHHVFRGRTVTTHRFGEALRLASLDELVETGLVFIGGLLGVASNETEVHSFLVELRLRKSRCVLSFIFSFYSLRFHNKTTCEQKQNKFYGAGFQEYMLKQSFF